MHAVWVPTWRKNFLSKKQNKVKNRRSFITNSDSTDYLSKRFLDMRIQCKGVYFQQSHKNTSGWCQIFFIKLDKYQCNRTNKNDGILKQQVSNVWIKMFGTFLYSDLLKCIHILLSSKNPLSDNLQQYWMFEEKKYRLWELNSDIVDNFELNIEHVSTSC